MPYLSTKTYGPERGLSCALRQWGAQSHCRLLHGYALGFRFTFAAEQLDARGWVLDFGKAGFGVIREWLHQTFDHTLLVAEDDPERTELLRLAELGLAETRVMPGVSCEALAGYVFREADARVRNLTGGRCWVEAVEVLEHGSNSALYRRPAAELKQVTSELLAEMVATW